jgi:hypothetical protein
MQLENLCMLRIYGPIWTSGGGQRENNLNSTDNAYHVKNKDLKQEWDNLEEARASTTRGRSIYSPYTKNGDGTPESNATISIPCRILRRKDDRNHGIHKHEKGSTRQREKHYFGHAKAARCRNCQTGVRGQGRGRDGDEDEGPPHARGGGTRNRDLIWILLSAVLFTCVFQSCWKVGTRIATRE